MRFLLLSLAAVLSAGAAAAQTQNLVFITNEAVPGVVTPGQAGVIGDGSDSGDTRKVVVFDLDDDGDDDVLFLNHGAASRGLLNDGFGSFTPDPSSADAIYQSSVGCGAKGVAVGDTDGDGDLDVFMATGPLGGVQKSNIWLANQPGAFTNFVDVSSLQPAHLDHSYDAAFLALNGHVAIAVANRVGEGVTGQNRLYTDTNDDGVFETVAPAAGRFTSDETAELRSSRALVVADFDGDGRDDLFVANAGAGGHANQVFRQTQGDLLLDEVPALLAVPGNSYGASAADLNRDGLPDLLVANRHTALTGEANQLFRNASWVGNVVLVAETGTVLDDALDPSYDVTFGDLDHDGDLDVIVANNGSDNAIYMSHREDDRVMAFSAGSFTRITDGLLQSNAGRTRSAVIAELGAYGPDANHQGAEVVFANSIASRNEFYRGMGKQFIDLGGATTGDVTPSLQGDGFFSPTSGGALVVSGGVAHAKSVLLMDISVAAIPYEGGTAFIDQGSGTFFASAPFHLDASGTAVLDVDAGDIPAGLAGVQIVSQVFTKDLGVGTKRGATNGLSIVIQ